MSENRRDAPLRQIGSLTKIITKSLESSVMTNGGFNDKPKSIETPEMRKPLSSKTQMPALAGGSGVPQNLMRAFTERDPKTVEKLLEASLPPSVKRSIISKWSTIGDEQYGWDGDFEGMEATKHIPQDDVCKAIMIINDICAPAQKKEIVAALGAIKLTTISRNLSSEDLSIAIAAYSNSLMKYPADAVVDALHYWSENEKFWPSLSELVAQVQRRTRRRMTIKKVLEGL